MKDKIKTQMAEVQAGINEVRAELKKLKEPLDQAGQNIKRGLDAKLNNLIQRAVLTLRSAGVEPTRSNPAIGTTDLRDASVEAKLGALENLNLPFKEAIDRLERDTAELRSENARLHDELKILRKM